MRLRLRVFGVTVVSLTCEGPQYEELEEYPVGTMDPEQERIVFTPDN